MRLLDYGSLETGEKGKLKGKRVGDMGVVTNHHQHTIIIVSR